MANYREFKTAIKVGGEIHDALIVVKYYDDDQPPDFDSDNDEAHANEMERFERGELLNVCILVEASWNGFNGTDSLGQCFIRANHFETDIERISSDHDMIETALDALKADIMADVERIKPLINQVIDIHYGSRD